MSRLEEALRRSRRTPSSVPAPGGRATGVFESPWSIGQEPRESAAAETAARSFAAEHPRAVPDLFRDADTPRSAAAGGAAERCDSGHLLLTRRADGFGTLSNQWLLSPDVDPAIVEQFRRLAASLLHGQRDGRLKVVMVTSAVAGEGKTLTSLNTALVMAESYRRRVLLIDADLRRPRLTEAANLQVTTGLGDALKAPIEHRASVTQLTDYLWFLPAGRPDPEPLSGLTSPRMQRLLEEAAERFDWVIVDTPPVTAAADAGLLGAMVDAAILVVKAGETPQAAVRLAIETIGENRIFGVVLNGVDRRHQAEYGSYGPYAVSEQ